MVDKRLRSIYSAAKVSGRLHPVVRELNAVDGRNRHSERRVCARDFDVVRTASELKWVVRDFVRQLVLLRVRRHGKGSNANGVHYVFLNVGEVGFPGELLNDASQQHVADVGVVRLAIGAFEQRPVVEDPLDQVLLRQLVQFERRVVE